jgi:hypothetical protein
MIRFTSIGESEILLADAVMTVPSPSLNLPSVDCRVTRRVSVSSPVLVHTGCNHESRFSGIAVLGADPKAGARVMVEEAAAAAVGAEVSGTTDTDPQAITASMVTRQKAVRNW